MATNIKNVQVAFVNQHHDHYIPSNPSISLALTKDCPDFNHAMSLHSDSFFTPALKGPSAMKEIKESLSSRKGRGFQKFPSQDKPNQEWSLSSFQLAKFLSQQFASRRRKTPLHSDGGEKKKKSPKG
jgi:hypothetical protein